MSLNGHWVAMSETQPWKFFALQRLNFQSLKLNFQFLEGNFKISEPCASTVMIVFFRAADNVRIWPCCTCSNCCCDFSCTHSGCFSSSRSTISHCSCILRARSGCSRAHFFSSCARRCARAARACGLSLRLEGIAQLLPSADCHCLLLVPQ